MKLRPIYNKKFGLWKLCHDQWCQYGETSVVAHILTSLDDQADAKIAASICDRFNAAEELHSALKLLHDNIVHAWPAVAHLGPVYEAKKLIDKYEEAVK
jgi:hypothetical protein